MRRLGTVLAAGAVCLLVGTAQAATFAGAYAPRQKVPDSGGAVVVRVVCPHGPKGSCLGQVVLTLILGQPGQPRARGPAPLGTRSFRIRAGHTNRIQVRLSSRGQAVLSLYPRVAVRCAVTSNDGAGDFRTRNTRITILAGRRPIKPRFTG